MTQARSKQIQNIGTPYKILGHPNTTKYWDTQIRQNIGTPKRC